jgi:hypothetical protein
MTTLRNKWAAFWLSLIWPGFGQLWAGRWSSLAYFAAVAASVAILPRSASWAAVAGLGVVAAEHAKRSVEADRWRSRANSAEVRSRVVNRSGRGRRVSFRIEVEVDRPLDEVWARVADLAEFVTIDPFHVRVVVLGPELRPGVELALAHNAFGLRFFRFGRLLSWREGRGYAFSDLSGVGGGRGFFPHVFDFSVEPGAMGAGGSTRLVVAIRGRWTTRLVPRGVGLWWFRYVCREHARLLKGALT